MALLEHRDVAYASAGPPSAAQTFDVYVPRQPKSPALVCFIHGGAWRTEDKADHALLARTLAIAIGCPVALPNYRLTPREPTPDDALHHPAHAADLLCFLEFVRLWHRDNGGHLPSRPRRLFLVGHSCAAHMLCTLLLRMPSDSDRVCPSDELVQSTAAVIMSEGIYDIDLLLASFPAYRSWFIENTFGKRATFEDVSALTAPIRPGCQHIRWLIIHSKGDTLVDARQSEGMYRHLCETSPLVSKSFDALDGEHSDVLTDPKHVDLIVGFIKRVDNA